MIGPSDEDAEFEEFNETALPCALEQVLEAMLPEDQALLVPHFMYGYSTYAIGRAIGKDKSTVRWQIGRAIRRTRERLGLGGRIS